MMKCFYVGSNSNADFAHSNVTLKSKQTADKRTSGQAKKKEKRNHFVHYYNFFSAQKLTQEILAR